MATKEFEHGLLELVIHADQVCREGLRGAILVKLVYHTGHTGSHNVSPAGSNDSDTVSRLRGER